MVYCFTAGLCLALVVAYQLVTWLLSRMRVGDYDKKHVLITGCDTGFGNLLAKRLDGLGFRVFAACLTSQGAEKLQAACSACVTTLLLDVTDEKSISAARDLVVAALPAGQGLWGIVNNAGIGGPLVPSEWVSREGYQTCLAVNLFGLIDVTRAFLPLLRRARGRVVNTGSTLGRIAIFPSPYCVSKYGVEAFSDCLRREIYRQGVKVCIIEPGYFRTDIIGQEGLVRSFKNAGDRVPADIRSHYPDFTVENFSKLAAFMWSQSSDKLHLVVDAYELALTSRFPPTRQLVGLDVRLFYRLLWNLPTPLADWILVKLREDRIDKVVGLGPQHLEQFANAGYASVLLYHGSLFSSGGCTPPVTTADITSACRGDCDPKKVLVTGYGTGFGFQLVKRLDGLKEGSSTTLSILPSGNQRVGERVTATRPGCLFGYVAVTRAFLPLVRRTRGLDVNMSSTLGRIASFPAPYCVSKCNDTTSEDVKKHYPELAVERAASGQSSDKLHLVVDAYELALTSRFPPSWQLDVRLFYRLLWNLPTALADCILVTLSGWFWFQVSQRFSRHRLFTTLNVTPLIY